MGWWSCTQDKGRKWTWQGYLDGILTNGNMTPKILPREQQNKCHEITVWGLNIKPFFPLVTLGKNNPWLEKFMEDSEQIIVSCQIHNIISKFVMHFDIFSFQKSRIQYHCLQNNRNLQHKSTCNPFATYDSFNETRPFCIYPHDTSKVNKWMYLHDNLRYPPQ